MPLTSKPPEQNNQTGPTGNPGGHTRSYSCGLFKLKSCIIDTFQKNIHPNRSLEGTPGFWKGLKAILSASWLNVFLVCIPVSWALNFAASESHVLIFVFSFLAIIPLAKLLALATEELSLRVGQTLAGLMNATFGNAVELIVAIIAVVKCELQVVQSSLVGSILSNLLLVLGMCFFAGGTRFSEQGFGTTSAQLNSSLLAISVIAVLLPGAFHIAVQPDPTTGVDPLTDSEEGQDVLKMSRGVAIILLVIYIAYMVFQLWSHAHLYKEEEKHAAKPYPPLRGHTRIVGFATAVTNGITRRKRGSEEGGRNIGAQDSQSGSTADMSNSVVSEKQDTKATGEQLPMNSSPVGTRELEEGLTAEEKGKTHEQPQMSVQMSIALLIVVTVLVAVTAEWLVGSIDAVTESGPLTKEWVGLILLPIVGNAAEHLTAVTVSVKDKLDLSISVAVGSSIQIALFVTPLMVILAWILNKPLLLLFDPFESVTLFLAVITVNYVVQDGKSNWLEGMILMCLYMIIAVSFWFYPGSDIGMVLARCQ